MMPVAGMTTPRFGACRSGRCDRSESAQSSGSGGGGAGDGTEASGRDKPGVVSTVWNRFWNGIGNVFKRSLGPRGWAGWAVAITSGGIVPVPVKWFIEGALHVDSLFIKPGWGVWPIRPKEKYGRSLLQMLGGAKEKPPAETGFSACG